MRKLYQAIRSLKAWPNRGRPGEDSTRDLLFLPLPYVAIYRVKGQGIEVLRIYHTAQDADELGMPLEPPAHDHLLLRIKRDRISTVRVQIAIKRILPA